MKVIVQEWRLHALSETEYDRLPVLGTIIEHEGRRFRVEALEFGSRQDPRPIVEVVEIPLVASSSPRQA